MPYQLMAPIYEDLCPGEIFHFQFTIYLPRTPAKGDIILAFDTTNSMQGVIHAAQENAIRIMDDLNGLISDVHFGVIDIEDYPLDPYGESGNEAYRLRQPLTSNRDAVRAAIEALWANGGGDLPEAYTRAIHEAHADPRIGWRDNARRLLLIFGDSAPHDDALNEGIPSPPYRPPWDWDWETGLPPSFLDPGRDGVPGTSDDLDFQTELAALTEHNITLLSVVTSSTFPQPDHSELVTYWNAWAARTGGKAVPLWNASELPELIRDIVEDTIVGVIKRLALHAEPEYYRSWVYSDPAEITDIPVPSDGPYSFLGRVEVPPDIPAGTYRFRIIALGDGINYGEKPVEITVPKECFPPNPDYPNWYYLPLISKEHAVPPPEQPPIEPTPYPGPDSAFTRLTSATFPSNDIRSPFSRYAQKKASIVIDINFDQTVEMLYNCVKSGGLSECNP
ncbi:MAG: hypothetical protein ACE5LU_23555 [Anaerolineae bacterium]